MAKLEDLPVEVMSMVLKNLASPEDLGSTIHASPRALAALQDNRRDILTTVICNSLTPEVLKEAISILNCPIFKSDDMYHTISLRFFSTTPDHAILPLTPKRWYHKICDFETWYFSTSPADVAFPQEMPQIIAVYRMRLTVNSLIADLVAYTNAISDPEGPYPDLYAPEKTNLECLTPCELSRVQAAFLRYELLCRLTGLPYLQQFSTQGKETFWLDVELLERFPCWTIEEARQVHDFIYSKYNMAFKEIDDDITALVNDNPKRVSRDSVPARQLIGKDGPRFLQPGARRLPSSFSSKRKQYFIHVYITNLSKLGLGALQCFLKKDRIGRRRFITGSFEVLLPLERSMDHGPSIQRSFPDKKARFAHSWLSVFWQDSRIDPSREEIAGSSIGWTAMDPNARLGPHGFDRLTVDFSKLCWAFWGLERLKKLGIITKESNESSIIFSYPARTQRTYQEQRNLDPDLRVLDQEVDERVWEKEFIAQFYTTPSSSLSLEEYHLQLEPILQFATDSGIEKYSGSSQ
ncbi:hypothetical protein VSDG_03068 [Cytospora chrysosperma]|uniref:Uncharacterized protein n=1 Tax=Cytospora chrysosperma TaxID=252740 RepID=A0A423W919_CYTCH|nr:hypothetical protein VSDG_03068 [Valsa sordida]